MLANTLHEIPVEEWLHLFEQIQRASQPDSTLLVIEDREPRIGELPHPRGFLILVLAETRKRGGGGAGPAAAGAAAGVPANYTPTVDVGADPERVAGRRPEHRRAVEAHDPAARIEDALGLSE